MSIIHSFHLFLGFTSLRAIEKLAWLWISIFFPLWLAIAMLSVQMVEIVTPCVIWNAIPLANRHGAKIPTYWWISMNTSCLLMLFVKLLSFTIAGSFACIRRVIFLALSIWMLFARLRKRTVLLNLWPIPNSLIFLKNIWKNTPSLVISKSICLFEMNFRQMQNCLANSKLHTITTGIMNLWLTGIVPLLVRVNARNVNSSVGKQKTM